MRVPQTEVIITSDGAEIARQTLEPGEYVIGREEGCGIVVAVDGVSRKHAKLTINYNELFIEDAGSSNGTFINGKPVKETTRLWPNQKIRIGDASIELRRVRTESSSDFSLAPTQAAVRRILPEEFLRDKKYDIGGVVAQGGMGAILNAKEATTERTVAMKVMLESGSPEDMVRFITEAKVTAQLEHPSIVPVYELSVDEHDQVFYTMKFVKGVTLRRVLEDLEGGDAATVKKYPLVALLTVFQKVCDAMAFAHSKRVIHRDLKPENIMLGDYGEVLVMDWGLAKVLGQPLAPSGDAMRSIVRTVDDPAAASATMAGSIMGTPQYMSPEQAAGDVENLDARTDIYALGAILYHILSLRPPLNGTDPYEVVARVREGQIDPLTAFKNRPIPDSLTAVVKKAMALDKTQRYARVTELQKDITAYQGGFATGAEKAGAWKQFTLFVRRNKAASIGVAAVLLIGGTVGTKAVVEGRRATVALARLRGTAPTFAEQSKALIENGKFDESLEKIAFAIELDDTNADYHVSRANTLQALSRLPEAAKSYRRALALHRDDAIAQANLTLCEKLLAENGSDSELTAPLKTKLLDAVLAQKRQADAVPLSRELKRDTDTAEATIKSRLKSLMAQPNWNNEKLKRLPDGTFRLDLRGIQISDLAILDGLPISKLDLGGTTTIDLTPLRKLPLNELAIYSRPITDLSALKGMKLKRLHMADTKVADLSPLAGMPLEKLDISKTPVTDLTPLRGLPLKDLIAVVTGIRDLRPLRDSPLESLTISDCGRLASLDGLQNLPLRTLNMFRTTVEDLSALRGSPIKDLWIDRCDRIRDLAPLADCKQLAALTLPTHISDIAFLKKHPTLKRLSNQPIESFGWVSGRIPTVAEFFAKNGERLARQVPVEKQLENFRQSLIAQGNDPKDVPRFGFDAEGRLDLRIDKLKCTDISELRGMAVTDFYSNSRTLSDLSPLAGAPLKSLNIPQTAVHDLSPLKGAPLQMVRLYGTRVRDLTPLRGMPLEKFFFDGTAGLDVSILAEFPTLQEVIVPTDAKGIEALRHLPQLRLLSFRSANSTGTLPAQAAAEFWKEFDAKKAAAPK